MGGGSHAPNSPGAAFAVPVDNLQHLAEDVSAIDAVTSAIENFLSLPAAVDVEEHLHAPIEPDTDDNSSMLADLDIEDQLHLATEMNVDSAGAAEAESHPASLTKESLNWVKLLQNPMEDCAFLDQCLQNSSIPAAQCESFRAELRAIMDAYPATLAQETPDFGGQAQFSKLVNAFSHDCVMNQMGNRLLSLGRMRA